MLVRKIKFYFLRKFLADIVFGATDGIVTTFTIVSGVEGAKLAPSIVIILGLVNLFADGVSMGASSFLSMRAGGLANNISHGILKPVYHAMITFFSFIIFGAIPLISFFVPGFFEYRFIISVLMTIIALVAVGMLRSIVAKEGWFRGSLEMLAIGGSAALIAYFLGAILAKSIEL